MKISCVAYADPFSDRYFGKIQDKDEDYYMQFNLVICGLDSVEARRWINATLVNMVDPENPESLKPLIDGGTEGQYVCFAYLAPADSASAGFKGQARVILPTVTSCYECSLDMLNKPTAFPICTIANTPRLPEHCIEWASVLEWPRVHGGQLEHVITTDTCLPLRREEDGYRQPRAYTVAIPDRASPRPRFQD